MGLQRCSIHGLPYQDYDEGGCLQCKTDALADANMQASMRRQEELLREQVQLMREGANEKRQHSIAGQNQPSEGAIITSATLSKDLLKSILDDAVIENSYDDEGKLVVREQGPCLVLLSKNMEWIRLIITYVFKPDVPQLERFKAVNKINIDSMLVRASVHREGFLDLDHDVLLNDGITRQSFVMTVKRFCALSHTTVQKHAANLLQ